MKKRILFAIPTLAGGGAERVVSVLSDALVELGYEVAILLEKRVDNEYSINPKVKIYLFDEDYSRNKGNKFSRMIQRKKIYRRVLTDYKPDYVIPFLVGLVRELYFITKKMNIKIIGTLRNNPKECSYIYRKIQDYVLENCTSVYLQTEEQRKFITQKANQKAFCVSNPVNNEVLLANKKIDGKTKITKFITCGRLNKQKNHIMMIEAFLKLHRDYPETTLEIYGEGPERDKISQKIHEENAEKYIFLMGRTNNIVDTLCNADAFIFSSDYEGMPNALMEAMAIGLPCISTDCPTGPKELIGNNERGILTSIGDSTEFYYAMISFVEDYKYAINLGEKAKKYMAENYDSKTIAKIIMNNIEKYCN